MVKTLFRFALLDQDDSRKKRNFKKGSLKKYCSFREFTTGANQESVAVYPRTKIGGILD